MLYVTTIAYTPMGKVRSEVRGQEVLIIISQTNTGWHQPVVQSTGNKWSQPIRILNKRSNRERRVMVKVMKLRRHAPWDPDQPPPGPTDLRPPHPQVIEMQYLPLIRPLRRHQVPKTNFKRLELLVLNMSTVAQECFHISILRSFYNSSINRRLSTSQFPYCSHSTASAAGRQA